MSAGLDLTTDPEILESYRRDQAPAGVVPAGAPAALARPRSTLEVVEAVRYANERGLPVVPRGAGSGLSGGANAIEGCLVVSLERMIDIRTLDARGMTATVEAGVVNGDLRRAAADEGLLYAPDPASFEFSTIGGNVATNAGGLCCVKYGVTRDSLLAVELVLADGSVMELGRRTRKGVVGYDLAALVCGSEGTLGIITSATVELIPLPPPAHSLAASFSDLEAAGAAIGAVRRQWRPSLLELMDRTTIAAVERMTPMDLDPDAESMVFAQSDAGGAAADEIAAIARVCEEAGATIVVTTDDPAEGRLILGARRLAYPALERLGATLLDDVAVPLPAIPVLLRGIHEIADRFDVLIGTFGHAGDGNMHPTIVYEATDPDSVSRALAAFDAILTLARDLGGTVTGEHGVGALKLDAARAELGGALSLHHEIKRVFDPANRMNPGKGV